ncbi:tetratricopeptide repeat protein [Pelomonas sp. SE-A7]|uniref:YfgM family protein n=1 Tax=Pelomonas sp. SE-A7 TaxID=3054953 RepID=UPI00259CA9D4|nr:tetratricopeptide repeat protein [Pelomonas sp. SE-A7]MDM4767388.1 tetratricopeptide repeat protein [Pelomonas sp. SE-A7]
MASHLDLEEQEQLEQLKAFWNKYGNLITWLITLCLLAFAGWQGWNWWQRDQATKATALYDALETAGKAGELDKANRAFADLKDRYPRTTYAAQGALLAAKIQFDKGQAEAAQATLSWAADNASDYREVAKLRLAGLQIDAKQYDAAIKTLDGIIAPDYAALVADRRGDIALLQNKPDLAKAEYTKAYAAMDKQLDYRRLIEAKLASLGAAPADEVKQ